MGTAIRRIWHDDPPACSYPSCIAVACAMLQSCAAGELLLEALREAVMMHAQNIARESVILSIARNVSETHGETFSIP
ncbi:MAG TPA: DsbA family protein [Chryseosolibacter sp.]|nr:DsbA family protein [Chryseosolibacter sp.]